MDRTLVVVMANSMRLLSIGRILQTILWISPGFFRLCPSPMSTPPFSSKLSSGLSMGKITCPWSPFD